MVDPEDLNLFLITDDVDAAVADVLHFYRVYHSMRYVGDDLVLRLERRLSDATLARLNSEFGAVARDGRIVQCGPLEAEQGEYPEKNRLKLHFDRKSFGRLRRMVDLINNEPDAA
jgi:hypothetical protein